MFREATGGLAFEGRNIWTIHGTHVLCIIQSDGTVGKLSVGDHSEESLMGRTSNVTIDPFSSNNSLLLSLGKMF